MVISDITAISYFGAYFVEINKNSDTCIKNKDFSAKCTLSFSDQPMNHRGCLSIKNIQNHRNHHSSQANKNNFNDNIRYRENNNNIPTHSSHNITSKNRKTLF